MVETLPFFAVLVPFSLLRKNRGFDCSSEAAVPRRVVRCVCSRVDPHSTMCRRGEKGRKSRCRFFIREI